MVNDSQLGSGLEEYANMPILNPNLDVSKGVDDAGVRTSEASVPGCHRVNLSLVRPGFWVEEVVGT